MYNMQAKHNLNNKIKVMGTPETTILLTIPSISLHTGNNFIFILNCTYLINQISPHTYNKQINQIQMNRQTLSLLSIQELHQYRETLIHRIKETKEFNNELSRDNIDLAAQLNQARIDAHKKKVNQNNFDFDDLYKIGKEKVGKLATKDTLTSLIKNSGKKIQKGYSFAGSYMKGWFGNKNKKDEEEEVDDNADFNSYNLGPPKPQPYNPDIATGEADQPEPTPPKRRGIFNREKDNQYAIKHTSNVEQEEDETNQGYMIQQKFKETEPIKGQDHRNKQKIDSQNEEQLSKASNQRKTINEENSLQTTQNKRQEQICKQKSNKVSDKGQYKVQQKDQGQTEQQKGEGETEQQKDEGETEQQKDEGESQEKKVGIKEIEPVSQTEQVEGGSEKKGCLQNQEQKKEKAGGEQLEKEDGQERKKDQQMDKNEKTQKNQSEQKQQNQKPSKQDGKSPVPDKKNNPQKSKRNIQSKTDKTK